VGNLCADDRLPKLDVVGSNPIARFDKDLRISSARLRYDATPLRTPKTRAMTASPQSWAVIDSGRRDCVITCLWCWV
jgi:hypothetical protein